jgi:hypothetical protein
MDAGDLRPESDLADAAAIGQSPAWAAVLHRLICTFDDGSR